MFDFAAFRTAVETRDAAAWLAFYTEDAEWLEYRHTDPPRAPNVLRGRERIRAHVEAVARAPLDLTVSDEVLGEERCAFALMVRLADGRRILEHVIVHLREGRIARQVDVEAWD